MLKKLLTSAVFAGLAAGLIAVLLHFWLLQPVLLEAELYESGAKVHFAEDGGHSHASGDVSPVPDAGHDHSTHDFFSGPESGHVYIDFGRDSMTVLFKVFVHVGYALILVAVFAFAHTRGIAITARAGLLWGLGGFLAVQLAPAVGLPPELPGMSAGDLVMRQVWWASTVVAAAVAFWLIAFGGAWRHFSLAFFLLIAPHLLGPPLPHDLTGTPPPELAALFATRTLGVGLASWMVLGFFAAYFWSKADD